MSCHSWCPVGTWLLSDACHSPSCRGSGSHRVRSVLLSWPDSVCYGTQASASRLQILELPCGRSFRQQYSRSAVSWHCSASRGWKMSTPLASGLGLSFAHCCGPHFVTKSLGSAFGARSQVHQTMWCAPHSFLEALLCSGKKQGGRDAFCSAN